VPVARIAGRVVTDRHLSIRILGARVSTTTTTTGRGPDLDDLDEVQIGDALAPVDDELLLLAGLEGRIDRLRDRGRVRRALKLIRAMVVTGLTLRT
jgi:hypothetical protein